MKLYIEEVNLWLPLLKSTKNVVTIFGNYFLVAWCNFLNPKSIPCVSLNLDILSESNHCDMC